MHTATISNEPKICPVISIRWPAKPLVDFTWNDPFVCLCRKIHLHKYRICIIANAVLPFSNMVYASNPTLFLLSECSCPILSLDKYSNPLQTKGHNKNIINSFFTLERMLYALQIHRDNIKTSPPAYHLICLGILATVHATCAFMNFAKPVCLWHDVSAHSVGMRFYSCQLYRQSSRENLISLLCLWRRYL